MSGASTVQWQGPKYNCKPGLAAWKAYLEQLVVNGSLPDKAGYSPLQCLFRDDEGARDPADETRPRAQDSQGVAIFDLDSLGHGLGVAEIALRKRLYKARKVAGFHLIYHSIDNAEIRTILSQAPYLMNGPLAFDYLKSLCCLAANEEDQWELQNEWNSTSIPEHIGYDVGTVRTGQGGRGQPIPGRQGGRRGVSSGRPGGRAAERAGRN